MVDFAGGFTERRYTPIELLELMVLADLRRRHFSIAMIRRLLDTLRDVVRAEHLDLMRDGAILANCMGAYHLLENHLGYDAEVLGLALDEPEALRQMVFGGDVLQVDTNRAVDPELLTSVAGVSWRRFIFGSKSVPPAISWALGPSLARIRAASSTVRGTR